MDVFTLYVAQGALAAVRAGSESIIVDAHMPDCDDVTPAQIEQSLDHYLEKTRTRGLILTGLDRDHACPVGIESILSRYTPDWVMYPTCYKDTDAADEVFDIIERHRQRRATSLRPLTRLSVRVDRVESRLLHNLAQNFQFELFSPHLEDMDSSNNSSIVLKLTGLDVAGFRYLITGDTETPRWERINDLFGAALKSDALAAPHHGSITGIHVPSLVNISADTVLISAGVDNSYDHPSPKAVEIYSRLSRVYSTNAGGATCLYTRRIGGRLDTHAVRHIERPAA